MSVDLPGGVDAGGVTPGQGRVVQQPDALCRADGEPSIGVQRELVAVLVDQGVVPTAEQDEVVQVSGAAVRPRRDVVGVQLPVPAAAGEAASLTVEDAEQVAQVLAGVPLGAPSVVTAEVGRGDGPQAGRSATTGQGLQGLPESGGLGEGSRREKFPVRQSGPPRERVDLDGEPGALSAAGGRAGLGELFQGQSAHLHESVSQRHGPKEFC